MIWFAIGFLGLLTFVIFVQLISHMKIVGGNELGILSGRGRKGFSTISGGRIFSIPLLNIFRKIDLTPSTIEVQVESAIAKGIIPLNVKATVSFAIASNDVGRDRAVTRILEITQNHAELREIASSIIEGHLRDAIATMTPEEVMQDKDTLVARLINVCKSDLENIGLEITTMNIADVDDNRLEGVKAKDLYIALLKRVQSSSAETEARQSKADAMAAATEMQELRRGEITVRDLENEYENIVAETKVLLAEEEQRLSVGVEEATRDAEAKISGLNAEINAERERIEMLKEQYKAEIVTPALAQKEQSILLAEQEVSMMIGKAQGELDELKKTLKMIEDGGKAAFDTYIIENFDKIILPFAETLDFFPVDNVSVISGADGKREPISAIHPDAIDLKKNEMIAGALTEAMGIKTDNKTEKKN